MVFVCVNASRSDDGIDMPGMGGIACWPAS